MIWELLRALHCPDEYAITVKDGEIYAARIEDIKAAGGKIIDRSKSRNGSQDTAGNRR